MPRLYGRKGFTTKKPIREILTPYEQSPTDDSTRIPFAGLPAASAVYLIGHLPGDQQADQARSDAPTLAELVSLGTSIEGAQLAGYRVPPDQLDERITFTRITIPHDALNHQLVGALAAGIPDPTALAIGPDGSAYAAWE